MTIRKPSAADSEAIRQILSRAFAPSEYEARLRKRVARGTAPFVEWVAERDSQIVAHILYTVATDAGGLVIGFHLAPVAVDPDFQGQGIGSELIRETLQTDPIDGASVFVLGDPGYYERFGFERQTSARCACDESGEHFRALRWVDGGEPFEIGYASAFIEAESE